MHVFNDPEPFETAKILGVDNTMFGSDFPHPEGLRDPLGFAERLAEFSPEDQAKVMGGNMARIVKVDDSVPVG